MARRWAARRRCRRTGTTSAGGPDDIRGFRESRLGPKDQFGNPYGGNMKVVNRNELILPMPAKWRSTARVSLFLDQGNVFNHQ